MKMRTVAIWISLVILAPLLRSDTLDLADGTSINGHVTFKANNFFEIRFLQGGAETSKHFTRAEVTHVEFNSIISNPNSHREILSKTDQPMRYFASKDSSQCEAKFGDLQVSDEGTLTTPTKQSVAFNPKPNNSWCVVVDKSTGPSDIDFQKLTWLAVEADTARDGRLYIVTGESASGSAQDVNAIKSRLTESKAIDPSKITVASPPTSPDVTKHKDKLCSTCGVIQVISYPGKAGRAVHSTGSDEVVLSNLQREAGTLYLIDDDALELQIGGKEKTFKKSSVAGVFISH